MKKMIALLLVCVPFLSHSQTSLQKDFAGIFGYNEEQIMSLAAAFPDDKFHWSPEKGVRSVADILIHVASANYFITMGMGFEPPKGVNVKELESLKDRKAIMETVKKSFAYAKEHTAKLTEANLTEKFTLPFGEFSKSAGLMVLLDHAGEHKGQLIAYARMNGITPPWSKAQ